MKTSPKSFLAVLVTILATSDARAMRWYSTSTGRWLSRDPIGEDGGQNIYAFVGNNPINKIDAIGLLTHSIQWFFNESGPQFVTLDGKQSAAYTRNTEFDKDINYNGKECLTYHVTTKAKYEIHFRVDPYENAASRTGSYHYIIDHEMHHVSIYNGKLLDFEGEFDNYKLCCKDRCKPLFYRYATAKFELLHAEALRDNIQFDVAEYLDASNTKVVAAINAANQDVTKTKQDSDTAKTAFDQCVSSKK